MLDVSFHDKRLGINVPKRAFVFFWGELQGYLAPAHQVQDISSNTNVRHAQ